MPALQDRRRVLVMCYYTAIVSLFTLFGVLIIPDVVRVHACMHVLCMCVCMHEWLGVRQRSC